MTRTRMAFLAVAVLLTLTLSSAGQTFVENSTSSNASRHTMQTQAQTPAQSPAESSVIVVKPGLTEEETADLYMARKEYHEATLAYKHLSDEYPRNPVYLNKLGIALHQQEALNLALKYYERAVKLDPTYADAQNNIGTIWYQRKKFGRAIKAYQKAITIRSDMPVLYSNLGYAYFGDKKYEQAITSFRSALTMDPHLFDHNGSKNGSVLQDRSVDDRGRFYFMLAKSFAEAGNIQRCLIYLRKAKDEGYKNMAAAKTDPSFAAVLQDPDIQEVLAPKPPAQDTTLH
jgi:tetratricopeptide (TPR) repeat protein